MFTPAFMLKKFILVALGICLPKLINKGVFILEASTSVNIIFWYYYY